MWISGKLENGKIYYIGTLSEYTYQPYMNTVGQNKQIRYECDKDYKLLGPNGSTCINGNWKPNIRVVRCVRDQNAIEKEKAQIEDENTLKGAHASRLVSNESNLAKRKMKKNLKLKRIKKLDKNNKTEKSLKIRNRKQLNHFHEKKLHLNSFI